MNQTTFRYALSIYIHAAPYLADEPGDEQKNQDTIMISAVTEEGVGHEGGEEGHLSVGLSYLHFPQLHLNGLWTSTRRRTGVKLFSFQESSLAELGVSYLGIGLGLCKLNLEVKEFSRRLLNLFCIGILLTDQLLVCLLEKLKRQNVT